MRPRATARSPARLTLLALEDRLVPDAMAVGLAVGAAPGQAPTVSLYDGAGHLERTIPAFEGTFTGGVRVAVMDLNGDGVWDVVAAPGPGGAPRVRAFDGKDGHLLADFYAYDPASRAGVSVAAGPIGGGRFGIVTGQDAGGSAAVNVFSTAGALLRSFTPFEAGFAGGVHVAVAPGSPAGGPALVAAAGPGGGPRVRVVDAGTFAPVYDFYAYEPTFTGGVNLAIGDVTGDHLSDVVTAPGAGGGPRVCAFDMATGKGVDDFMAGAAAERGGTQVGVDLAGPGASARVVAAVAGAAGLRTFDPATGAEDPAGGGAAAPAAGMAAVPYAGGGAVAMTSCNAPACQLAVPSQAVGVYHEGEVIHPHIIVKTEALLCPGSAQAWMSTSGSYQNATANLDYVPNTNVYPVPTGVTGDTGVDVPIPILADLRVEPDEVLSLDLQNCVNCTPTPDDYTGNIKGNIRTTAGAGAGGSGRT